MASRPEFELVRLLGLGALSPDDARPAQLSRDGSSTATPSPNARKEAVRVPTRAGQRRNPQPAAPKAPIAPSRRHWRPQGSSCGPHRRIGSSRRLFEPSRVRLLAFPLLRRPGLLVRFVRAMADCFSNGLLASPLLRPRCSRRWSGRKKTPPKRCARSFLSERRAGARGEHRATSRRRPRTQRAPHLSVPADDAADVGPRWLPGPP